MAVIPTVSAGNAIDAGAQNDLIAQVNTNTLVAEDVVDATKDFYAGHYHGAMKAPVTTANAIDGSATPQAVAMSSATTTSSKLISQETNDAPNETVFIDKCVAQSFITPFSMNRIIDVRLILDNDAVPNGDFVVQIYKADADDKPTGSALGSVSVLASTISASPTEYTFTFASEVEVSRGSKYAIVCRNTGGSGGGVTNVAIKNSGAYSGGKLASSSDAGATWTTTTLKDFYFKIYGRMEQGVEAACASSGSTDELLGFIYEDIETETACFAKIGGVVGGFTGLTTGTTYYLSDTAGAISASAGTVNIKAGLAISTTELLIIR